MRLKVAKWGNSLAVRLPTACLRAAGLKEGDILFAEINPAGKIALTLTQAFDKAAFLKRVRKRRAAMPMTSTAVATMRQEERY